MSVTFILNQMSMPGHGLTVARMGDHCTARIYNSLHLAMHGLGAGVELREASLTCTGRSREAFADGVEPLQHNLQLLSVLANRLRSHLLCASTSFTEGLFHFWIPCGTHNPSFQLLP